MTDGLRVLLVDDHRLFSEALTMLLRGKDTIESVTAVGTAEEAVAICEEQAPDVVLMDLDLPGMDGLDAIERILLLRPETRVVVVTALRKPEMVARAVQVGAVGFVHKSRAADDLISVVERAAAGSIVISPDDIISLVSHAEFDRASGRQKPTFDRLTGRELEILRELAEGKSTDQVAETLFISRLTVQSHVKSILSKLGVHSKLEAVTHALRQGIIELPRGA
jgi:two-component system nitrate/nitrite response regulator NarL